MKPLRRRNRNQYMNRESEEYRDSVKRELAAYHRFVHAGIVAQGTLQYLSCSFPSLEWNCFGSWLRTIRPGIPPTEMVCAAALRDKLPDILLAGSESMILARFVTERIDTSRSEGLRLTGEPHAPDRVGTLELGFPRDFHGNSLRSVFRSRVALDHEYREVQSRL